MTEEDLIEKIKLYSFFMKEGSKCPGDTNDYEQMIIQTELDLLDLKNS
jgi:hypothetical protein